MPLLALTPGLAFACGTTGNIIDLTNHTAGVLDVTAFVIAYALVMAEESIHLPKSKPFLIAAGIALMGRAKGKYTFFGYLRLLHLDMLRVSADACWPTPIYFTTVETARVTTGL